MNKLFLAGHPIVHSLSPRLHERAYQALGLDWTYEGIDCNNEEDLCRLLYSHEWRAGNITTPWKQAALASATLVVSEAACCAGGANVVWHDGGLGGGRLCADNTDGIACVWFLESFGHAFAGKRIVVCGSGSTARAIAHAAFQAKACKVVLLSRSQQRAEQAVCDMSSVVPALSSGHVLVPYLVPLDYPSASEEIKAADIIIDATTLGMKPGDPAPFDVSLLSSGQVVLDCVYGHSKSALIAAARRCGCCAYDGVGMLTAQVCESIFLLGRAFGVSMNTSKADLFALLLCNEGLEDAS